MSDDIGIKGAIDIKEGDLEPGDTRFYSVTTILKTLHSEGILYWSKEQVALGATSIARSLAARLQEDGEDNVVKWLIDSPYRGVRGQRPANELGTMNHSAFETLGLTGERPPNVDPEVVPFLDQFDKWCNKFQPVYKATEMTVYSLTYGYAGTLDAIFTVDGMDVVVDYKTSRKSFDKKNKPTHPYPEVGLQLAAYRYAELVAVARARRFEKSRRRYYVLGPEGSSEREMTIPVPHVDGGLCLHITPEHCDAYPVKCDEEIHTAFLYVLEAFRFQNDTAKTVLGEPLIRRA